MPTEPIPIDSLWKRIAILATAAALVVGAAFSIVWAFANTIALKSTEREVAELSTDLASSDPQTHYAAAVQLEKTFEPENIERSLAEFEKAAALSPNNFIYWAALGRARERSGDRDGAENALRRAAELAPNYARVRWALGNILLRRGEVNGGFAEIRRAVDSDHSFAFPAATTAWQIFGGDPGSVKNALGESTALSGALVTLLSDQKRFDEAVSVWNGIELEKKKTEAAQNGKALVQKLIEGKQFRLAASVAGDAAEDQNSVPAIGKVTNGGFESGVKMQNAGPFEWQIAQGVYPQIALTDGQKSQGGYSLVAVFGTPANLELRGISQIVAVEPGRSYSLTFSGKTELKTNAAFRWEVVAASDGKRLAASEKLPASADWSEWTFNFTVPNDSDGVILRLVRDDCAAPSCNVSGRMWFDDFRFAEN